MVLAHRFLTQSLSQLVTVARQLAGLVLTSVRLLLGVPS